MKTIRRKAFNPEELAILKVIVAQYPDRKVPQAEYKRLSKQFGRTHKSLSAMMHKIRKDITANGTAADILNNAPAAIKQLKTIESNNLATIKEKTDSILDYLIKVEKDRDAIITCLKNVVGTLLAIVENLEGGKK